MRKSIDLNTLLSINPLTLPMVKLTNKESLPESSAIYFVFNRNELLYIGKARNLNSRWNEYEHHIYPLVASDPTVCISWLITDHRNLAFVETLLVEYLNPSLNKTTPAAKKTYTHTELLDAYYMGILKGIEIGKRTGKNIDFTEFNLPMVDPTTLPHSAPKSVLTPVPKTQGVCPNCGTESSDCKGKPEAGKQRYFCKNPKCTKKTFTLPLKQLLNSD